MFQTKVFSAPCHVVARATVFCAVMVVGLISRAPVLSADIIQVGDLNIINDPGNPSNGLRYLDMSFSDGLTLADALANAQATYPNARLATPSEADDLFNASGLSLDNTYGFLNLSGGWETGPDLIISSGSNYDTSLRDILGHTGGSTFNPVTIFWTDPDGDRDWDTTGDAISFNNHFVYRVQGAGPPPGSAYGWLLVSEATAVPEPASLALFASGLVGWIGLRRRKWLGACFDI